jgi:hypothetical protein
MESDLELLERPGLDAEIALCFTASATSSFAGRLVVEVEKALMAAKLEAEKMRLDALDPVLSRAAQRNSRELAADAQYQHERLRNALEKLRLRHIELKDAEENARRLSLYQAAAAERDAVAEQLRGYPDLVEKFVGLLTRLRDSNSEIAQVNAKLPAGVARLENAELLAKGLIGRPIPIGYASITDAILQPWTPSSKALWPPR